MHRAALLFVLVLSSAACSPAVEAPDDEDGGTDPGDAGDDEGPAPTGTNGAPVDADAWADSAAQLECQRYEDCDPVYVDEAFGDLEGCLTEVRINFDQLIDELDELGCTYVPSEGAVCLQVGQANEGDCTDAAEEAITAACEDVFDCPGG